MGPIIGVIGGSNCTAEITRLAEQVGEGIAERKGILICGGLSGVMQAVCRGAKSRQGLTIGVLPGMDKSEANEFVDIPIVTGLADARNVIITRTADAVIAVDGEFGTLSEISFALKFGKPVVGLRTWAISSQIITVESPQDAVEAAFEFLA